MNDRMKAENILSLLKGTSGLYLHGSIEAACPKVNEAFKQALNDNLALQHNVFKLMEEKGWYQVAQAEQQQKDQVKQKFAAGS